MVRKDPKTQLPRDGDITVCFNLLAEVRRRATMVIDNTKKAEKYMNDITEYLATLDQRGVICPLVQKDAPPSGAPSMAAGSRSDPKPATTTTTPAKTTTTAKKGSSK